MRYLLDSNIVIDILRGDSQMRNKVEALKGRYCTNVVILAELYKGAFLAARREEALRLVDEFAGRAEMLETSGAVSRGFGEAYAKLLRAGKPTQDWDLMIACNAMAYDATLITRNSDDFKHVSGLKLLAW